MTLSARGTLLNNDSPVSDEMREIILGKLDRIEDEHRVRILFAIESGSRAWGFPSPDSDFDARFVYVHDVDWYLSIAPGRDVIELPIEGDLDINGWDLKKALGLMRKSNPVLLEWLQSPVRYRWNAEACQQLIAFAETLSHQIPCHHHYRKLCQNNWQAHFSDKDSVPIKKYFYAIRPAMVLRWLRMKPDSIPPMDVQSLADGINMPEAVTQALNTLLARKSETREIGKSRRIDVLDEFIQSELAACVDFVTAPAGTTHTDDAADVLFRRLIRS